MNLDQWSRALFWTIPFASTVILAFILLHLSYKDKDEKKIMFMLATAFASIGYCNLMLQHYGVPTLWTDNYKWSFIPLAAAVCITTVASLLKLKSFDKPFKCFLPILGASIVFLAIPSIAGFLYVPLLGAFMEVFLPISLYLVIKRRSNSEVMFFLAFSCFMFSWVSLEAGMEEEITVLLTLFAIVFSTLMFTITQDTTVGGMTSFVLLQSKLDQRTRELAEAREKLLKAERLAAIGELAGMVGHDLRNPLTGIAGATYYLKLKGRDRMSEKEKVMIATIEKAIDYSNKIISDLLDYSREIKLDLRETDPKSLMTETLTQLEVPAGITVINGARSEPRIIVDKDKMRRVCTNLINNAFDAMPSGGTLTIKSEEVSDLVSFSFTDTGVGMNEETLQKIWTPLFTTKAKGMGFGLPICKRLVEAHNGKISVKSQVGRGSTFIVTVPIKCEPGKTEDVQVSLVETVWTV